MRTIERLDEMVAKASQIDGIGERAEKAAEIYLSCGLTFQRYHNQVDEWLCRSSSTLEPYTVSHIGGTCGCSDFNAPRPARLGKLCKHRLAIMFAIKLRNESLAEIARRLQDAPGGKLRIEVVYGENTLYFVTGVHIHGTPEIPLEHPISRGWGWYRFQVDPLDVAKALGTVGWGVTMNTKQRGLAHTWSLAPGVDEAMSLAVIRGMAGNARERRDQNARLAELEVIEDLYYA